MKTATETTRETTVAATIAGEDVSRGDFVALLNVTWELPSFMWDSCQAMLPVQELVRLRMIPSDAGEPLKVFAVCLPFVYARTSKGDLKTLDLRRQQIVRLNRQCARKVWDELKDGKKN